MAFEFFPSRAVLAGTDFDALADVGVSGAEVRGAAAFFDFNVFDFAMAISPRVSRFVDVLWVMRDACHVAGFAELQLRAGTMSNRFRANASASPDQLWKRGSAAAA
ncbi:MAG: hypothetical protein ABIP63_09650 [Thermoanaerobaculia bacterium]